MSVKKIQIKPPDNSYADVLHPETDSTQVLMTAGETLETFKTNTNNSLLSCLLTTGGIMSGELNMADQLLTRAYLKDYAETLVTTPATTGTVTIDLTTGNNFNITPTGIVTFAITNSPASGRVGSFTLIINMGATVYTPVFPSSVSWNGGTAPTFIANKTSILAFTTKNGGARWYATSAGTNFTT